MRGIVWMNLIFSRQPKTQNVKSFTNTKTYFPYGIANLNNVGSMKYKSGTLHVQEVRSVEAADISVNTNSIRHQAPKPCGAVTIIRVCL